MSIYDHVSVKPMSSKDVQHIVNKRPWSEAFQDSAVTFVDQLIDENRALFEELARL